MADSPPVRSAADQPTPPAEKPLAQRAVRGGLWVALSSYWTLGFGFIINIILTRLLSPEAFGTFALATFFAQLLLLQPKLSIGYAFAQYKETDGQSIGTYFAIDSLAAVAGLLLVVAAAPILLALGYSTLTVQVSIFLAAAAMAQSFASIATTFLEKELRFGSTSLVQSVVFPLSYVPALFLAARGGGVWSLVAQNIVYAVLLLIGVWWYAWRLLPGIWRVRWRFSRLVAKRFLRYGIIVGLGLLAGMLLTTLDNFMIGTIAGVAILGFYDRAYRITEWPNKLFNSLVTRTTFYTYARIQSDRARLQKTMNMVLWMIMLLALPLALAVFITAPDLIAFLYGPQWLPSTPYLRALALVAILRPLWENAGALFNAIGKPQLTTRLIFIQVLVLLATGIPLTLRWGAIGTCVAVGAAFLWGIVLMYRHAIRELQINLLSEVGIPVMIGLLTVLGYILLNRAIEVSLVALPVRLVLKAVYAVAVYYLLTFLLRPRVTRERMQYVWGLLRPANR